ncbi:monothiol glutaredoxin-S11-like [Impatiens glandulifera]|uniref:monothiol glutaredoxin-S11-like n=1 Tax=Impatiens glandulifera TaxID=253017 RepID=UPI001FB098D6|nr:monothiol glutaredoxin-S11-like [Impatiens glandulifera]
MDRVKRLVSENRILIFSKSSCCLSYVVHVLLQDLGANPFVCEIDKEPECREMEKALVKLGCSSCVPAVFIGGKLMGSTNEIMSLHLSGSLMPLLNPSSYQMPN